MNGVQHEASALNDRRIDVTRFRGVPETMLIPLWARAAETNSPRPIIQDAKAVELVNQIDYDFDRFSNGRLTQAGVAVRTMLFDTLVRAFLERHGDEAVVVNLGAGLDTRHARLNPARGLWFELDLPESIAVRRCFFAESERYRFIAKSLFDLTWMDDVAWEGKRLLLIAEGLLMYFPEDRLKVLFQVMAERLPGALMYFEAISPLFVGRSKRHETLKKTESVPDFLWGLKNGRDLNAWHPGLEYLTEWSYYDYHKERWGWFGRLARLPFLRSALACRIVSLRFGESANRKPLDEAAA